MNKRKEFGEWIKQKRLDKGITLQGLSERLGYRAFGSVNSFERGMTPLPLEKIHPYADALGIPLDDLLSQIRECEPELYAKYTALRKDIAHHLVYGPHAGLALHHFPFREVSGSDNEGYVKSGLTNFLYIMSTCGDTLSPVPPLQESLKFPDTSLKNQMVLRGFHETDRSGIAEVCH